MRPRLPSRSRRSLSLAVLVVALLAVGAFFARGPIGLGNGPLTFGTISGATIGLDKPAQVAVVVPVTNPGKNAAVINGITLVGGGKGYQAPKLAGSFAAQSKGCETLILASQVSAGGCATSQVRLAGATVRPSRKISGPDATTSTPVPGLAIVAVLAPPPAGDCWILHNLAVHYRIGIRHFTATTPEHSAVCAPGVGASALRAALAAAGG